MESHKKGRLRQTAPPSIHKPYLESCRRRLAGSGDVGDACWLLPAVMIMVGNGGRLREFLMGAVRGGAPAQRHRAWSMKTLLACRALLAGVVRCPMLGCAVEGW